MRVKISGRERNAILSSLAAGVVPSIGLHHIQVGRKDEVNALLANLASVEDESAFVRFVAGRYGSGKTFFLNLIKAVALEKNFVVAAADITTQRRLHGTQGQARSFYSELMSNVATRSRPDGGALPSLIESWVSKLIHQAKTEGQTDASVAQRIHEACIPLQDFVGGYDFAIVVEQYYKGFADQNEALQQSAIKWLRAEYSTKTEAKNDLGVRNIIDDKSIYDHLKLMAGMVKIAGYAGLLVCIDELVVLSHRLNNKIARNNNYEAILCILNDCLQGTVKGLGFIFATTDDCLEDPRRGLFSYEALATRLAPNRFAAAGMVDYSAPVMKLGSLSPEDCYVLLDNIRRVHAKGDKSQYALPDEALAAFLTDCNRRMGSAYFQTPRETVKDFISLLRVLEQNPNADWRTLLGEIKTSAKEALDPFREIPKEEDGPDTLPVTENPESDLSTFKL